MKSSKPQGDIIKNVTPGNPNAMIRQQQGNRIGVDVLDVVVEDILTPVEEGAYDVMAVTEYVDYETEPDRYIREIEEAMQRLTVALKELKEYYAEYEWNIGA